MSETTETVLVQVKSDSRDPRASPGSRIRIPKAQYDAEMAASKKEEREPKYFIEPDQACEGMTGADLEKAQADRAEDLASRPDPAEDGEEMTIGPGDVAQVDASELVG